MRITVHIDRLVLEGVRLHQGTAVGRSLERELTRLLATGNPPQAGAEQVRAAVPHSTAPAGLGIQAARAIHQGWKK